MRIDGTFCTVFRHTLTIHKNQYVQKVIKFLFHIYIRGRGWPQSEYAEAQSGSCVAHAGSETALVEVATGGRRSTLGAVLALALALALPALLVLLLVVEFTLPEETDLFRLLAVKSKGFSKALAPKIDSAILLLELLRGFSRPAMPTAGTTGADNGAGDAQGEADKALSARLLLCSSGTGKIPNSRLLLRCRLDIREPNVGLFNTTLRRDGEAGTVYSAISPSSPAVSSSLSSCSGALSVTLLELRAGRGEQGMERGAGDCRSLPKSLRKSYPPSRAMFSPTCRKDKLEMPSARLLRELPASDRVTWFCRHSGQLKEASSSLSRHRWKIHLLTHSLWKQCEQAKVLSSSPSA
mmetsp:Transcript_42146/g.73270  ORF Transcript_42146/g.73270 Transcript_42146/m.73270 type:complete len:352 (-) Transcript_42146:528-1583(-)